MTTKYWKVLSLLAVFAGYTASAFAEQPEQSRRIEQLIRQLDADSYHDRTRAHRQLVEIGVPATDAIRKATKSKSAEVRYRAKIILGHLLSLEMQGVWQSDDQVLVIQENHWWWGSIDDLRPAEYDKSSFRIVNVGDESFEVDLLVGLGGRKGQTCKALFQLDGDTLHYSGSYNARPTGLKNGTGYQVQWKRLADAPTQGGLPHQSIEIAELVHQLDDNSFRTRERASRQLLRIGEPALGALQTAARHSSAEIRHRAKSLIELIQRFQLYTVSRDGSLFRLEVAKNHVKKKLVAKLGAPFDRRNARTEGLAVAPDGRLYASVVFVSNSGAVSRLYQISPLTGAAKLIGDMATTEIDGLDFGPDGKLYGAISSGSKTLARGLRQIVTIDMNSGAVSPTANQITFSDLDALTIDLDGRALVTNGSRGLFSIDPKQNRSLSHVFVNDEFRQFLRASDEMEGLCMTREGVIFGLCDEDRTFLVRLDPRTERVTRIGDLGVGALCLAARKFGNASEARDPQRAGIQESTTHAKRQAAHAKSVEGTWNVIFREGIGGDLATIVLADGRFRLLCESGEEFEGRYFVRKRSGERLSIDVVHPDGRTAYVIARVEGDTLTYCGSDDRRARPSQFVANEGDGRFFFILRRSKNSTNSKLWRIP